MHSTFRARNLLQDELDYELRIRGVTTRRDAGEKCKVLQRLIDKEIAQLKDPFILVDPDYDFRTEQNVINASAVIFWRTPSSVFGIKIPPYNHSSILPLMFSDHHSRYFSNSRSLLFGEK